MKEVVVGVDIGSHKVAVIVGEVRPGETFIIGSGVSPSRGFRRGEIADLPQLRMALTEAILNAERASGYEINRAFVNLSDGQINSMSSQGAIGISGQRGVNVLDLEKVLENARAIAIPHNTEILHVLPRNYALDGRENLQSPIGMHGFRLELEAHIVTARSSAIANLREALSGARVHVDRFLLSGLAAASCVLSEEEAAIGALVIDFGAGTTDMAHFIDGAVWHTAVVPIGSALITQDITYFLRIAFEVAERVKLRHGYASESAIDPADGFIIQPFGEGEPQEVKRAELAMVIEARAREIFEAVKLEINRSGLRKMLRAGVVLTGGGSELAGLSELAAEVLEMPVRLAGPRNLTGTASGLQNPAFSTSIGLLRLGLEMSLEQQTLSGYNGNQSLLPRFGSLIQGMLRRLLPDSGQTG